MAWLRILGTYHIFKNRITASGHGSGASLAHQFHIAHSKELLGVGMFSGSKSEFANWSQNSGNPILWYLFTVYYLYHGLYRQSCNGSGSNHCTPGVANSLRFIRKYNKTGLIDNVDNLRDKKVYVYCGAADPFHGVGKKNRKASIYEMKHACKD